MVRMHLCNPKHSHDGPRKQNLQEALVVSYLPRKICTTSLLLYELSSLELKAHHQFTYPLCVCVFLFKLKLGLIIASYSIPDLFGQCRKSHYSYFSRAMCTIPKASWVM